jgi:hypothetical protein
LRSPRSKHSGYCHLNSVQESEGRGGAPNPLLTCLPPLRSGTWPVEPSCRGPLQAVDAQSPLTLHCRVSVERDDSQEATLFSRTSLCSSAAVDRWGAVGQTTQSHSHVKIEIHTSLLLSSKHLDGALCLFWPPGVTQ